MTRWVALASVVALGWACSGETSTEGTGGGSSSGGTSTGGASTGGTSTGGTSTGGTAAVGGTTPGGGGAGAGGSPAGGGGTGGAIDAGACQEGGALDAAVETVIAQACVVAVVRVARIDEECSGAGGAHVTFDVLAIGKGSGVTKVSHGGHAYWPPANGPDKVGEYFVAGIDPYGKLVPQPDNPGWCIVGLPSVDGYAHTFVEATSEADAKAKMQAILSK